MPHFVKQRELYEARERPSKTYSWQAFMLSNILSELPYDVLMGTMIFFCWYYPIVILFVFDLSRTHADFCHYLRGCIATQRGPIL